MNTEPDPFLLSLVGEDLVKSAAVFAAIQKAPAALENPAQLLEAVEAASSVKSAARVAGLSPLGDFAAAVESTTRELQAGTYTLSPEARDALSAAAKLMEVLASQSPDALPGELEKQQQALASITDTLRGVAATAPPTAVSESTPPADTSLLELFRIETETAAKAIEEGLIVLERAHSPETLEAVMRAAHSLKGAARLLGFDSVVKLAHTMEDLLVRARNNTLVLDRDHTDAMLAANDVFQEIARLSADEIPANLSSQANRIRSLTAQVEASAAGQKPAPSPAPAETRPAPERSPVSPRGTLQTVRQQTVRVTADTLSRMINRSGEVLVRTASLTAYRPVFRELARTAGAMFTAGSLQAETTAIPNANEEPDSLQAAMNDVRRLQQQLLDLANDFETKSVRLEEKTRQLYDAALSCRLQCFAEALEGLPRMVRDVARLCGKEAQLAVTGEDTLVDRDVLELLNTSLNHLVRNGIDHGLEPPEIRVSRGKPAIGSIRIEARHHAGMLEISVADDGAGVPREKLRQAIVSRGSLPKEVAQSLSDAELLEFLFLPGFSIRTKTTEISGRGVGLDSVQQMVRSFDGWIGVQSIEGQGTTFSLRLPVAVSVSRCLLVEIAGELYASPLGRIERVVEVDAHARECALDHHMIALAPGWQVLKLPPAEATSDRLFAVIYCSGSQRYGMLVERLAGIHDIAVSPLPAALGKVPAINGSALLDDGRTVMVLDTDDVLLSLHNSIVGPATVAAGKADRPTARRWSVLLVDDSESVRTVLRRTLEHADCEVTTAGDGMEALNLLGRRHFDLLVTDIDMPRLDGIELVRRVRAQAATAAVPIIVASYRDSPETQERALHAGANRFIAKASLGDDTLMHSVRELLS